ncbi:hypothetical protein [Ferrimonas senticii]|uniref:hypothetical protein n=1 Tax=Ferrimonas senticii TaxID=394566 RepID=UPI0003FC502B|nr:hypothetical protein [Ferrimonas senticii]
MNRTRRRRLATTSLCERRRIARKRSQIRVVQRTKLFGTIYQDITPEVVSSAHCN